MSTNHDDGDRSAALALDRHDQRRRCGVPTVSVLIGPVRQALGLATRWVDGSGRRLVLLEPVQPDPESIAAAWVDRLVSEVDLATTAAQWLARRLDRLAGELTRSLQAMTAYEKSMFLESVLPAVSETGVELVSRWLIERVPVWSERTGLALVLDTLLEGRGRPYVRVFTALGELVGPEYLPVTIVSAGSTDLPGFQGLARLLADLAAAQPRATLILAVEQSFFDIYLLQAPISRARALLQEGVVSINHQTWHVGSESERRAVAGSRTTAILDRGFDDDDPARIAAERLLFERLESQPQTVGLFELNGLLDFRFGSTRWIEVDLVARSLKLAVEVDGYHHFQDTEAYRRDRRKDLELQKHGYLVVRVLADDVVERCEDVMNTVQAAVAFCRAAALDLEQKE